MSSVKRIAIVGGGFAGIGCTVGVMEAGMEPVCFEKTDKPGGTWCYREESTDGVPSTMATTIVNHSKEMGALSFFPPKKEYNIFMRHDEIYRYIMEVVEKWNILRYVRFNSEVVLVKRSEDYKETGRWLVTVRDALTGQESTDVYDGVMLCVGHINRPKMPQYPGQERFKGKVMHTHSLKRVDEFREKNVVVVGMGCSGLDAAVESSNVAKQVYLSTRSGAHVLTRVGPGGCPFDYCLFRSFLWTILDIFPRTIGGWLVQTVLSDPVFDHNLYAVKPKSHLLSKDPCINEQIGSKLLSGLVIQKPGIESFTENGVVFKDDPDKVIKADVVIMATGYTWKFSFLEEGILVKKHNKFNLYKCIFPTHLEHPSLAFIGFILPFGPGFPIGELQVRLACSVFQGQSQLPFKDEMDKDVEDRYSSSVTNYDRNDEKMSIRVDFIPYLNDIASKLGVKPNLLKYFFTDIRLFCKLVFGPFLPYQFRLQGPFKLEGAREAIMTVEERMTWPLTREDGTTRSENFFVKSIKIFIRTFFSFLF